MRIAAPSGAAQPLCWALFALTEGGARRNVSCDKTHPDGHVPSGLEGLRMLQLTEKAVDKVKELLTAEKKDGYGLRVAIQGGGCSGFQYGLTFDNEERPNDQVIEANGLKVYVDAMSGMYLEGVKIDYIESLEGSGFKIDNPKATGSCGCGHSFQA